jgi:high-affinity iron transporter
MSSAFIQAAVILLREGLEAMLVIAALAGYLTKAGAGHRINALYGGALAAVGASIVAAWLFAVLNSGEHSDILEGCIILIAAGLMLYVSGWLMVKQDPRGWQDYLAHKADGALAQDTVWAVAALAFLAVFREGAETVLFINALATTEGGWSAGLFAGLGAATVGRCGRCSLSPRHFCSRWPSNSSARRCRNSRSRRSFRSPSSRVRRGSAQSA